MSPESLFLAVNYGVLPFWAMLLVAPRWKWTQRVVHAALLPMAIGASYCVATLKASFPEGAGGTSLAAVMRLFDRPDPWMTLALWFHYVSLDLFAGAWLIRDAVRHRIPHWLAAPCLVATNLFAPAGLLVYLAVRALTRRTLTLEEIPTRPAAS